jgi:hypothetical protein
MLSAYYVKMSFSLYIGTIKGEEEKETACIVVIVVVVVVCLNLCAKPLNVGDGWEISIIHGQEDPAFTSRLNFKADPVPRLSTRER